MSTRNKLVIAAGIVAVLVGIVIWDGGKGAPGAAPDQANAAKPQENLTGFVIESDVRTAVEAAGQRISDAIRQAGSPVGGTTVAPQSEPTTPTVVPVLPEPQVPAPVNDSYEVQSGDSLYVIAERKYGDGNLWKVIADANPSIKANTLRVGTRLVIPPKPTLDASASATATREDGKQTYTVQPGDSLTHISMRFYKTGKYAGLIYEENKSAIENPDHLVVGTKLVMPTVTETPEAPVVTAGEATAAPAGDRKTYKVRSGDNLWKIAKTVAGTRGILETMQKIRELNGDKIVDLSTPLQVNWVLQLPE